MDQKKNKTTSLFSTGSPFIEQTKFGVRLSPSYNTRWSAPSDILFQKFHGNINVPKKMDDIIQSLSELDAKLTELSKLVLPIGLQTGSAINLEEIQGLFRNDWVLNDPKYLKFKAFVENLKQGLLTLQHNKQGTLKELYENNTSTFMASNQCTARDSEIDQLQSGSPKRRSFTLLDVNDLATATYLLSQLLLEYGHLSNWNHSRDAMVFESMSSFAREIDKFRKSINYSIIHTKERYLTLEVENSQRSKEMNVVKESLLQNEKTLAAKEKRLKDRQLEMRALQRKIESLRSLNWGLTARVNQLTKESQEHQQSSEVLLRNYDTLKEESNQQLKDKEIESMKLTELEALVRSLEDEKASNLKEENELRETIIQQEKDMQQLKNSLNYEKDSKACLAMQLEQLHLQISQLNKDISLKNDDLSTANMSLKSKNRDIDGIKEELTKQKADYIFQVNANKQRYDLLHESFQKESQEKADLDLQNQSLHNEIILLQTEIEQRDFEISKLNELLNRDETRRDETNEKLNRMCREKTDLVSKLQLQKHTYELHKEKYEKVLRDLNNKTQAEIEFKKEKSRLVSELAWIKSEKETMTSEIAESTKKLGRFQEQTKELEIELSKLQSNHQEVLFKYNTLMNSSEAMKEQIKDQSVFQREIENFNQQKDTLQRFLLFSAQCFELDTNADVNEFFRDLKSGMKCFQLLFNMYKRLCKQCDLPFIMSTKQLNEKELTKDIRMLSAKVSTLRELYVQKSKEVKKYDLALKAFIDEKALLANNATTSMESPLQGMENKITNHESRVSQLIKSFDTPRTSPIKQSSLESMLKSPPSYEESTKAQIEQSSKDLRRGSVAINQTLLRENKFLRILVDRLNKLTGNTPYADTEMHTGVECLTYKSLEAAFETLSDSKRSLLVDLAETKNQLQEVNKRYRDLSLVLDDEFPPKVERILDNFSPHGEQISSEILVRKCQEQLLEELRNVRSLEKLLTEERLKSNELSIHLQRQHEELEVYKCKGKVE
ncbi:hypothetical protein SPOG_01015 [Schizosaccharomyces cryophilus OY26]|uniref:Uncharacterized protein n=1 Tax=Schizosaccharomyces cryophilus (strain OY26 / ATCC MYA-4695 / CBS 11777 / NBRC 106824 / NRRL Y48691) TaxID=653667 RepID=S9VVN9_SCHCR|nr:uncharacterized protein SPOG_01015 [Schizosaccharomyces cryophilus OY26]EPY50254.1 hypothetical protein SPOG_01015 [Schizosaccharomyces cryophilus OY26]